MDQKKLDHYYKKAKADGYVARSVYKLEELDKKYKLLRPHQYILDLGAAPGSWMQYIVSKIGPNGFVQGLDMADLNISLESNMAYLKEDIFKVTSKELLKEKKYDLILSDLAPKTSGNKLTDQCVYYNLIEHAVSWLPALLKSNGNFVFKFFQGSEYQAALDLVKPIFSKVKNVKPLASRKESTEIFVLCQGYVHQKF